MLTVYMPRSRCVTALPSAFLSVIVALGPTTPTRDVAAGSPVGCRRQRDGGRSEHGYEQQSSHVTFLHLFFYALGPIRFSLRRGACGKP